MFGASQFWNEALLGVSICTDKAILLHVAELALAMSCLREAVSAKLVGH